MREVMLTCTVRIVDMSYRSMHHTAHSVESHTHRKVVLRENEEQIWTI